MDYLALLAAFSLGLFGGAHCIGMCGGIMGVLATAIQSDHYLNRFWLIASYNLGRMLSYVSIALIFYFLVSHSVQYLSFNFMRILSGILLIAMGLYLADWWRGLVYLEKGGAFIWKYIQPLTQYLLPVTSSWHALLLGMLWGWLPCGLIYTALVYSATAQTAIEAGLLMFAFALGTLPTVMLGGLMAERVLNVLRLKQLRRLLGVLVIGFGVWTLLAVVVHVHPADASAKHHHHH